MDDQEIRDRALSAATMISPMSEGDPSFVLDRARMFEQYLRDGAVANSELTAEEITEARVRLLHQLANFVSSDQLALANWLRGVALALELSEPWPVPPRLSRALQRGNVLRQVGEASTNDPQVARWLADVKRTMDASNEPDSVELPRFERVDNLESFDDASATARLDLLIQLQGVAKTANRPELVTWLGHVSDALDRREPLPEPHETPELHVYTARDAFAPQPPDDVEKLRDAAGVLLVRSPWVTGASASWCWCKDDVRGPALMWTQVLNEAQLPLVDVTTEERKAAAEQNVIGEEYPMAATPDADRALAALVRDDPDRSTNPERYEERTLDGYEVLVCRDCERTGVDGAGRGNVVDVVRHDAYHEEQDQKAEAP